MNKKIFHVHLVVMVYCNKQNVFFFYPKTPLTSDYMFYIYLTLDIVWIFITTFYTKCGEASDSTAFSVLIGFFWDPTGSTMAGFIHS